MVGCWIWLSLQSTRQQKFVDQTQSLSQELDGSRRLPRSSQRRLPRVQSSRSTESQVLLLTYSTQCPGDNVVRSPCVCSMQHLPDCISPVRLPRLDTQLYSCLFVCLFVCLFILLINARQERGTQLQFEKNKTTVWIKWPTQGCATFV